MMYDEECVFITLPTHTVSALGGWGLGRPLPPPPPGLNVAQSQRRHMHSSGYKTKDVQLYTPAKDRTLTHPGHLKS